MKFVLHRVNAPQRLGTEAEVSLEIKDHVMTLEFVGADGQPASIRLNRTEVNAALHAQDVVDGRRT